ncbi:MAG TPA: AEC family transporter [Actinobacteria bacterium]|nr:AEC family transporter [Actinomycetota bacterium]
MGRLLQVLVDILLPVFAIVGVGAVAGRRLRIDPRTLSTVAYWITGPAFVFAVLSRAELGADLVVKTVLATAAAMAAAGVVGVAVTRARRRPAPVVGAVTLTSIYGNVGNFGLAIVAFAYGDRALPLAGIVLVVVNVVGLVVGVAAAHRAHGWTVALRRAILAPMTLAVAPAIAVNLAGSELPLWLDRSVGLLADALIPMMLVTLGVQLAGMRSARLDVDGATALVSKLLVAPLAAVVAGRIAGLTGIAAGTIVLQSAMPPAVFTALIGIEHDLEPDLVTATVVGGTLLSVLTLPLVLLALG